MKVTGFRPKNITPNQLDNYILIWQYNQAQNVFRLILNPSKLRNFKNFTFNKFFYWLTYWLTYFTYQLTNLLCNFTCLLVYFLACFLTYLTHSLTHSLTYLLMPSDKYSSTKMARATDLMSSVINITSSRDVDFTNCSSYSACIMMLPLYSFVPPFFLYNRS